jgi:ABC-type transport system substrate-binding protein
MQYLAKANLTSAPSLTFRVGNGCTLCINTAQIVQSDLAQLGITVTIDVVSSAQMYTPTGAYAFEVQHAADFGNIGFIGGYSPYAPGALTPADDWLLWVSNKSLSNNWAIYSNPVVQKCVDSFTSGSTLAQIQALCTAAQRQIYDDAPYAWIALPSLWWGDGSIVWNKHVIRSFQLDPVWSGATADEPVFNTVTFVGG